MTRPSPRPFYIIGHNPNRVEDALLFLRKGANAIEPDIHWISETGRFKVCHDEPTDSDPYLEEYLEELATELEHDRTNGQQLDLRFITFDLKPDYEYDLNLLYDVIRAHFTSRFPKIRIATTVSEPDAIGFLRSVEGRQQPNEFVGIDENTTAEDAASIFAETALQCLFAGGIDVFDFAPLNSLVGPRSFLDRIHRGAELRDGEATFNMVYVWTVNNEDDIRDYLALEPAIDGILTDKPELVREIIQTEFQRKFTLSPTRGNSGEGTI